MMVSPDCFPLPDFRQKRLTPFRRGLAHRLPTRSTTICVVLRDRCQVATGYQPPACVSSGSNIRQGVVEGMAHVQTPVTLGGGIMMVNVSSRVAFAPALNILPVPTLHKCALLPVSKVFSSAMKLLFIVLFCARSVCPDFPKRKATLPRISARCVTNAQEFSLNGGKGLAVLNL